jgi:bifunctional DNA-binding transcriptional regulator/antitoxin component of YhaV-PrlF toxin-antitoxin module
MPHYQAKMSSKAQLTMPSAVREHFDLKTGDIVDFYVDDTEDSVRLIVGNKSIFDRLEELKLPPPPDGRPVTLAEMDEAIGEYLAEKHERISREWEERHEFGEWKRTRDKRAGS